MERFYCKFLRTPDGEDVEYERVRSVGEGPYGNILDLYKVTTKDGKKTWEVYIDMYHEDAKGLPQVAPPGLLTLQQYTALQLKGRRKSYLNIWQPSGSQFCPVVAASSNGTTYVSRIVPTESGRDIEVLTQNATDWTAVGSQGHALTGGKQGYTFLADMAIGPDGVVWVLAVFTFPGRTLLYSFAEGEWRLRGPSEGNTLREGVSWDSGLHFLGKQQTPCHICSTSKEGYLVLHLNKTKWDRAPVETALESHLKDQWVWPDNISKAKTETWFVWETDREKPDRTLKALAVTGVGEGELVGPITVEKVPGKHDLDKVAVSYTRVLAAAFRTPKGTTIRRCTLGADGASPVTAGPTIPGNHELADLKWSPDGVLYAAFEKSENEVALMRVDERGYSEIGTHSQPKKDGNIFDPHIYFDGKGKPIVVWADWFR
jgi:hypothetical protein